MINSIGQRRINLIDLMHDKGYHNENIHCYLNRLGQMKTRIYIQISNVIYKSLSMN